MKKTILGCVATLFICCGKIETNIEPKNEIPSEEAETKINSLLDQWHDAASKADYEA